MCEEYYQTPNEYVLFFFLHNVQSGEAAVCWSYRDRCCLHIPLQGPIDEKLPTVENGALFKVVLCKTEFIYTIQCSQSNTLHSRSLPASFWVASRLTQPLFHGK
uniref:Uncharacterized protein n=1 Tax=Rhipicephalus zambeziensis TaxID=60191 RepID=A0A224YEH4_9ACAR